MKGLETAFGQAGRRFAQVLKALTRYEGFGNGAAVSSAAARRSVEGTDPL